MFSPEYSVEENELLLISDFTEIYSNRRVAAALADASLERPNRLIDRDEAIEEQGCDKMGALNPSPV